MAWASSGGRSLYGLQELRRQASLAPGVSMTYVATPIAGRLELMLRGAALSYACCRALLCVAGSHGVARPEAREPLPVAVGTTANAGCVCERLHIRMLASGAAVQ